jgi:hypothetical protein
MKTLLLEIEKKTIKTKKKAENRLLWFNMKKGKLEEFRGGKLSFHYDSETNTNVPFVEDMYSVAYVTSDNRKEIMEWINTNHKFVKVSNFQESKNHIAVEVDDNDLSFVEAALFSAGIRHDWSSIL